MRSFMTFLYAVGTFLRRACEKPIVAAELSRSFRVQLASPTTTVVRRTGIIMKEDVWRLSADAWLHTIEERIASTPSSLVSQLRTPEQFVLCNIRLWWNADGCETACASTIVRNGFVAANLSHLAHESFELFMLILASAGRPRPVIHPPERPDLSDDEACLLILISLCQKGHRGHAIMILKRWLPPTAYRESLKNVGAFAQAAADEGLLLPMRMPLESAKPAIETYASGYLH
jgi:hypothetical protein